MVALWSVNGLVNGLVNGWFKLVGCLMMSWEAPEETIHTYRCARLKSNSAALLSSYVGFWVGEQIL